MSKTPFVMGSERHLHHPWCNFSVLARKSCKQCDRIFAKYPDADINKHFPNVIIKK